jgi:hypothetical protein
MKYKQQLDSFFNGGDPKRSSDQRSSSIHNYKFARGLVPDRSPEIKNQVSCVLLQRTGTIYFGLRVSRVLALLLSIFSEVFFPECTDLYRASMSSIDKVSTLYLFGAPGNYRSIAPPSPHSPVCRSLPHVCLQRTNMICFVILGFESFGSSLFGFLRNTFPRSAWIFAACPPRSSGSDLLQSFGILAPSLFANS